MITVFLKIISIFMMIGIGFAANKKGMLPEEANKYLVPILLKITTPCMILGSIGAKEPNAETYTDVIHIMIFGVIFFLAASLLSFVIVKLMRYRPIEDQGMMMVIMTACNTGFMGFPVTKAIFGDDLFFLLVMENVVLNVYLFGLTVVQMNYKNKKNGSLKDTLKAAVNICTIASLAGVVLLFTKVKMPVFLMDFLNMVGDATIPISMIIVGIQLAQSNLKSMITNKKLILASIVNVIVIPFLTFLMMLPMPVSDGVKIIITFAAAFPCAVATTGIAAEEGLNADLMAEGVALTTAMSLITLPISASLLISYFGL